MTHRTFEESSREGGLHHLLARTTGRWTGRARTWFEPGKLGDDAPVEGEIRAALGGRFVVHEYRGTLSGHVMEGHALVGFDLVRGKATQAWADSCHNGTATMVSEGPAESDGESWWVLGSYPDPSGGPSWGWRTRYTVPRADPDRLEIRHFNVTPSGEEALAVEILYARVREPR